MKKIVIIGLAGVFGASVFAASAMKTASEQNIRKVESQISRKQAIDFSKVREVNNFEDAVVAAFANNQGWFAEKTEKEIARIKLRQSKMAFLPSLTGSLSTIRTKANNKRVLKNYNEPEGPGGMQIPPNPRISEGKNYQTQHSYELALRQNIFNGWQTINTMSQCNNEDKAAYHKLKGKGSELIVDVLDAYSDVWKCRQALSARIKMETNLKKTFESQRTKLESGISTPADVAAAETNYQKAVFDRINSETELLSAESKFEKITGVRLAQGANLPDLQITIPKSIEQLISISLKRNHSILQSRFVHMAAMDALKVARGRLAPSINASVRYGRNMTYQKDIASEQMQNEYSGNRIIGELSMEVPIFNNSGNDYSQIGIAEEQAKQAQFKLNDTVVSVKNECVVNWNTFISTDAMIVASRSAVESAQLSSESYQEESELGVKSNTDVWDQENKLQESKINLAKSKKERLLAGIKISYLMGELELTQLIHPSASVSRKK